METNRTSADEIEIRNDEINEVLKKPPNWLMKWGIPLIFSFFGVIVLIGFIIKVPTYVRGTCQIEKVYQDLSVIKADQPGIFYSMLGQGELLNDGDTIGFIRNKGVNHFLLSMHSGKIEKLFNQDTLLVNEGVQLLSVISENKTPYLVSMQIGLGDYEMIAEGQNLEIHINGVPMEQYGFFTAAIDHINPVVDDSQTILISGVIETEAVSSKGLQIPDFENNLMGSARIKTNESSLLFRTIFKNLIKTQLD